MTRDRQPCVVGLPARRLRSCLDAAVCGLLLAGLLLAGPGQAAAPFAVERAAPADTHLAEQRVATARTLQVLESRTADAAATLAALKQRRDLAEQRLAAAAAALQPMLPLLQRLSRYPAETLLAVPAPPDAALRGLIVLNAITRQVAQDAEAVRAEQATVARLTAEAVAQDRLLSSALAQQGRESAALDRQIADADSRRAAADAAALAAQRVAQQAARAATLHAAMEQIDAARRGTEAKARQAAARIPLPEVSAAPGWLGVPVAGVVLHRFGEGGEDGHTQGISYQPPPAAHVSSPCAGRVVFAGPFRSFGMLVIIDCGRGLHAVLAGLDRLDAAAGRPVQQGEPVGVMAGWDPRAPGTHPALYMELRRDGLPVDPEPFLHARS